MATLASEKSEDTLKVSVFKIMMHVNVYSCRYCTVVHMSPFLVVNCQPLLRLVTTRNILGCAFIVLSLFAIIPPL